MNGRFEKPAVMMAVSPRQGWAKPLCARHCGAAQRRATMGNRKLSPSHELVIVFLVWRSFSGSFMVG